MMSERTQPFSEKHRFPSWCAKERIQRTYTVWFLNVNRVCALALQPDVRGSNTPTPAGTKLVNVAGTAPSVHCARSFKLLLEFVELPGAAIHLRRKQTWRNWRRGPAEPVYSQIDLRAARFVADQRSQFTPGSTCIPEQLASSRLCGSRIKYLELCRRGSDGVFLVMRTCHMCAVNHTACGYSCRTRWWGSMSLNTKTNPLVRRALDKSPGSETLTGRSFRDWARRRKPK